MLKYSIISFILAVVYLNLNYPKQNDYLGGNWANADQQLNFLINDFSSLRDTLYTFDSTFIEVNLALQKAFLHKRSGEVKEFPVSSGTARLKDGIDTQEGLFVIKAKLKEWHSRQFDSTLLINWMGFNNGIGFHALQGNSYYRYLGKRRSSHGCIRISREMSKEIYSLVSSGTPVLIHSGNNAVSIGFANKSENYLYPNYDELTSSLPQRYQEIYSGRYFISPQPKIIIDYKNVYHSGLPIGNSKKIPKHQRIIPVIKVHTVQPDNLYSGLKNDALEQSPKKISASLKYNFLN
ncbi:MAG TPA: L,D-transpeptidase [Ignavibacteriaceae bacterium]|nr:L,D-transpeptidase [Ignavibacteriaceae bacterium]